MQLSIVTLAPSLDKAAGASTQHEWLRAAVGRIRSGWRAVVSGWRRKEPSLQFAALDIDKLAERLQVESRGRTEGAREHPDTAEQRVSGTQKEIIAHFRALHRQARSRSAALTDAVGSARNDYDVVELFDVLRDLPSRAENQLRRLMAKHQATLELLRDRETRQRTNYDRFREQHGLQRVAEYPSTPLLHYALMAALIVIGAAGMARIAPEAADAALPTTTSVLALVLVAAGVLVPFALGAVALRAAGHHSSGVSLLGWLGCGFCFVAIGALALFAAHYVESSTGSMATLKGVLGSVLADPFAFVGSPAAWMAAGMVALIAVAALIIGYKCDDPYPGYGQVQRAFYAAHRTRERFTKRLLARMNSIIDRAEKEAQEIPRRLKKETRRYAALIDEMRRMPAQLVAYEAALEEACNIVLERYRVANEAARQTSVPATFMEQVSFGPEQNEEGVDPGPVAHAEETHLEERRQHVRELETEVAKVRQRLRDLNWLAIGELSAVGVEAGAAA